MKIRIQFENQFPERLALVDLFDPLARQVHQRCQVAPGAENLGLEATDAAGGRSFVVHLRYTRPPTT